MNIHLLTAVVGFSVVASGVVPVGAQGLADLAKKAEETRKTAKAGTETYTNADAGNVPAATVSPVEPAAAPAAAAADGEPAVPAAPAAAAGLKDEAYYAAAIKDLRAALDRDLVLAAAVQTQINSLTADFVNRDDPVQRSVIEQDRNRAMSEFARLQKQIVADRRAITDFEDGARRANVPPGWLR